MPNLNISIDASLLAEINYAATKGGLTQRDWVIEKLTEATNGDGTEAGGRQEEWQKEPKPPVMLAGTEVLAEKSSTRLTHDRLAHDPNTCRVYGCLMCEGKK